MTDKSDDTSAQPSETAIPGKSEPEPKPKTELGAAAAALPAEILEAIKSGDTELAVRLVSAVSYFAGPLPHPDLLERYASIVRDGGERIVGNWEEESRHRRGLESKGQWIAAALAASAIVAGVVCTVFGYPWAGGGIVAFTMVAIAATGAINLLRRSK